MKPLPYTLDDEKVQANFDALATAELSGQMLTNGSVNATQLADNSVGTTKLTASVQETLATVAVLAGRLRSGSGTPEGAVTASVGTLYLRTDGGANTTLYVKESGTGNVGWVAK